MRRFKEINIAILIVCLLAVTACPGVQTVKPFELGKVAAETILYDARVMQNKGIVTADQFAQVKKVYDQLKVAQDIAIDARKAVITFNTADNQARVTASMASVISISTQLIGLAQSMGIKVPGI